MREFYEKANSTPIHNKLYRNQGDLTFTDLTMDAGLGYESFSSGTAYVDLDNDGFLDLVTNNLDYPAFIFRNISTSNNQYISFTLSDYLNMDPVGARITLFLDNNVIKTKELIRVRGYVSSVSNILHFGLGESARIARAIIKWPNGVEQVIENLDLNKTNKVSYSDENWKQTVEKSVLFTEVDHSMESHEENDFDDLKIQVLLPHMMSKLGPFSSVGDMNNDGYLGLHWRTSDDLAEGHGAHMVIPDPPVPRRRNLVGWTRSPHLGRCRVNAS